jgi:hypothetical protein
MKRHFFPVWWAIVLAGSLLSAGVPASAQALHAQMQKVVGKFVEQTGNKVMAVGSWVGGTKFNPASSDFDMRLIVGQGGTEAQQLAKWKEAQQKMASLIRAEFGGQADDILARTNLYAPNQLMKGVENTADAMERFQKMGRVPNLGYKGSVTASTPAKFAEGLYGKGAETYIQGYEKATGRLFYSNGGKVATGLAAMDHLDEARYTIAGTANTAGQWAEHCMVELQAGRSDKVIKYLERMERDLVKSRSLSKLPMDHAFRTEMQNLRNMLKNSPGRLADVADDVARLLTRTKAEAAILGSMENAGTIRKAYLRVMLDGVAAKNKLGQLMDKFMKALPPGVNAQNAMNALALIAGTPGTAQAIGRGDTLGALGEACSHLKWVKFMGPLLLAEITTEILRETIASGYIMAAGSQDAWDLMAGVYRAWGRVDVDPDPRRTLTLADMVANFQYEHKLEAIVYGQCLRASTRNLGAATGAADQGVADAIFAKCWPIIRDAWRWERDLLASEYLQLASEVVHTPLLVYYSPNKPQIGQVVTCTARSFDGKLNDRLERMREIIRILYGKGSGVAATYYWKPDSSGDRLDWQCPYKYAKNGKYPVQVRLVVQPFTKHTKTEHRIMLRREMVGQVEVEVGGEAEICPSCGKPAGTSPNCMRCALHRYNPEQ